nr:hypothetical protein [Brevundimonas naejangsanensis]
MGMIYGLSWPLVIGSIMEGSATNLHVYGKFHDLLFLNTIAAIMTAAGLLSGWKLVMAGSQSHLPNARGIFSSIRNPALYNTAFWVMLTVAIASQILYTMDYGGLFSAFKYSKLIRSGLFDYFARSRFSFLAPFGDFALLACYGFWGLILTGRTPINVKIGFASSMASSIYVLYLAQGRFNAVAFFAIIAMATILTKVKKPAFILALVLLAVPASAYATYEVSNYFGIKSSSNFLDFYVKEVSFVFIGFFAQLSNPDGLYRFFYDVITYPAYLLPSSVTGAWLNDPSDLNTALIHGASKGQQGITSGMPVDIVTMGLMQMNFAGIIPYAMLYGALLAATHRICMSVSPLGVRAILYAYICIKLSGIGLFYAQPATIVVGNFSLIVALLVAVMWTSRRQVRVSGTAGCA